MNSQAISLALNELHKDGAPPLTVLTPNQRNLLDDALKRHLSLGATDSPLGITGEKITELLKSVNQLGNKAEPALRYALRWFERNGYVVLSEDWHKVVFGDSPIDPTFISRYTRSHQMATELASRLERLSIMPKAEQAMFVLAWIIRFSALTDGPALLRLIDSRIEDHFDAEAFEIVVPNPKGVTRGKRVYIVDPVGWLLLQRLNQKSTWAALIDVDARGKSHRAREIIIKYLENLAPPALASTADGTSRLNRQLSEIADGYLLDVEPVLMAVARGDVVSFGYDSVLTSAEETAKEIAPPAYGPLDSPQALGRYDQQVVLARSIGQALTRSDSTTAQSLLEEYFPIDSIVSITVTACLDWLASAPSPPASFLPHYLSLLAAIFGEYGFSEFNEFELAEAFSDVMTALESDSHRIKASQIMRKVRAQDQRACCFRVADVEGFGGRKLAVDSRLILEEAYQAALAVIRQWPDRRRAQTASAMLTICYRLGLRPGEACRLEMRDIEPGAWLSVHVRRRVKTPRGRRWIPAFAFLTATENESVSEIMATRFSEGATETSLLFGTTEQADSTKVSKDIAKVLREVTGDPTMRLYQLRHSFATWLFTEPYRDADRSRLLGPLRMWPRITHPFLMRALKSGGWIYQISYLLGHAHPSITMLHYVHSAHIALGIRVQGLLPTLSVPQAWEVVRKSRAWVYQYFVTDIDDGKISPRALRRFINSSRTGKGRRCAP